jgi:S-formylglutathione hydrolase FrmB
MKEYFKYLVLVLGVLLASSCSEETSTQEVNVPFFRLQKDIQLHSSILGQSIPYTVLLPEGYDQTTASYPVVYLLHGFGDNNSAWHTAGAIQYYSDMYVVETGPMIFVMPTGFNSYYINRYSGSYPYMDMFVHELVPEIDKKFRTKADRTQRATMGYSMGGYGALILPVKNPSVFSVSVPLSMSFRTDEQYLAEPTSVYDYQWAPYFGPRKGITGEERLSPYFKQHSPFHFFKTDVEQFNNIKFFIDCGDDEESLSITNDEMDMVMRDHNIPHEYRVRNGSHSFDYWKKSYKEALLFIGNAFRNIPHPGESTTNQVGDYINEDRIDVIQVGGRTIQVVVPNAYEQFDYAFPVLYLMAGESSDKSKEESSLATLSCLNNLISQSKLTSSILVEVSDYQTLTGDAMQEIVAAIDSTYRTKTDPKFRVVLGNYAGGDAALRVAAQTTLFTDCYLFNADLNDESIPTVVPDVYFFLDRTDESDSYSNYQKFYKRIRQQEGDYDYRVRQGGDTFQSFVNGLYESLSNLSESLVR